MMHPARWRLIRARTVHTLAGPPAEAVLALGDWVVATGAERDLKRQYPVEETVRLDGVLLPGFNDAHMHPTMSAEHLLHADCSPDAATSADELERILAEHAAGLEPSRWVIGTRYDHTKSTGGTVVDRHFLDRVVGDRPALLIHVAVHWGVLSSAGLRLAGIDDDTPDPPGGAYGRDAGGRLTGVLYEQALFDVAYPSLARRAPVIPASPLEDRLVGLRRMLERLHAAGLTSVCDALCGPDDLRLLAEARRRGELTMRVGALLAYPHFDALSGLGLGSGFGDERLRLVGLKAFVDGACAGGNCLVGEPFEGTDDHGMQLTSAADLDALVARAYSEHVVLGVHANGDRAIRLLLDAHEKARAAGAPAMRHRIEHCSLVDDDILRRTKELGLVVVPFGSYARFHGDKLPGYYGTERLERLFAHRSLLDAGIAVAGSSDYPCGPFEPLEAITSCVQRRALDGSPIGLSQRISVRDAIELYTTGAAFATAEEHLKGRLAPGLLADLVELDADPFAVDASELPGIAVRSTWVGGEPVYDAAAAPGSLTNRL
jgi:predicted amidohydrolase YtcJ